MVNNKDNGASKKNYYLLFQKAIADKDIETVKQLLTKFQFPFNQQVIHNLSLRLVYKNGEIESNDYFQPHVSRVLRQMNKTKQK